MIGQAHKTRCKQYIFVSPHRPASRVQRGTAQNVMQVIAQVIQANRLSQSKATSIGVVQVVQLIPSGKLVRDVLIPARIVHDVHCVKIVEDVEHVLAALQVHVKFEGYVIFSDYNLWRVVIFRDEHYAAVAELVTYPFIKRQGHGRMERVARTEP